MSIRSAFPGKAFAFAPDVQGLSAHFVKCPREADEWLASQRERLPQLFQTYTAAFFSAASSGTGWRPLICSVSQGTTCIGMFFAKEKTLWNFRTGLIYADCVTRNVVAAAPAFEEQVFHAAVSFILRQRRVHGMRISVPPDSYEYGALAQYQTFTPTCVTVENHLVLPLPASYGEFLLKLGSHTRRNIRLARRVSGANKHEFAGSMAFADFRKAALTLTEKNVVGSSRPALTRALAILSAVQHPMLAGLRGADGSWLAVLGGWYVGERPVVFIQMNDDRDFAEHSLSLLLRSFVIEALIERKFAGILFWGGIGGPLAKYAIPLKTMAIFLDKPTGFWQLFRRAITHSRAHLPEAAAAAAEWIVPANAIRLSGPLPHGRSA